MALSSVISIKIVILIHTGEKDSAGGLHGC